MLLLRDEKGRLALRRRPDAGLLAGMWEPVNLRPHPGGRSQRHLKEALEIAVEDVVPSLLRQAQGATTATTGPLPPVWRWWPGAFPS